MFRILDPQHRAAGDPASSVDGSILKYMYVERDRALMSHAVSTLTAESAPSHLPGHSFFVGGFCVRVELLRSMFVKVAA
eukprot:COSAG02_NODE_21501_length_785_cov_1.930029_1_plen_78_part_10